MGLELTAEQRRVVDHCGGRLRVVGGAGSGKTTALLARYRHLVAPGATGGGADPSSVLVLCPTRAAAGRFRDAVVPHLAGAFDALPITTFFGLAFDLVNRYSGPVTLLTGVAQRHIVARLLAAEDPADWPTLGHLLGRPALVGEVAAGLLGLPLATALDVDRRPTVLADRGGPGAPPPWPELVAFAERYRRVLADHGRVDASELLARAANLLADPAVAAAEQARFAYVLVDDFESATPVMATLLAALVDDRQSPADDLGGVDVVVAGAPDGATGGFPGAHRRHLAEFEADVEVDLRGHRFRHPGAPVLVTTRHPSIEPEAVAGELLAARAEGVAWSDMAVLVRRPRHRARAIARALARHGIPARVPAIGVAGDDPVVDAVVDMLRWVGGDATALDRLLVSPLSGLEAVEVRRMRRQARIAGTALHDEPRLAPLLALRDDLAARATTHTPAELAFHVWQQALGHLVDPTVTGAGRPGPHRAPAESAETSSHPTQPHSRPASEAETRDPSATDDLVLDGLVAFLDALGRDAERNPHHRLADVLAILDDEGPSIDAWTPDPWRVDAAAAAGADAVTVTSIVEAAGREWHTVIVAGCVEGELPALGSRHRLFDADPSTPPAERRRQTLAEERRLFALACSRATGRLVATAGPEPGVLLSRFVEGWEPADVRTPAPPGRAPAFRRPTVNPEPIVTDAGLALSATQVATYDDCPLRYAYRYVVRVRDEGGVRADLGTLVHEVLARFLDPATAGERPRTEQTLMAMAEEMWRHDIARYRPQVQEARRDFYAMLEMWWKFEGQG